uniref:G_PROTEIN_RECEP_F2_4 domain-containing protein n=1 Tax=Steinernema glaseri TaxID=37863 RepID=A0A1I7ZSZ1_9BILA
MPGIAQHFVLISFVSSFLQKNYRHMFINVGTFLILVVLYSCVVFVTCRKTKQDKLQRQAAFQSAAICGFAMGADIFCIIVQNIDEPSTSMCYIANFAWQLAHDLLDRRRQPDAYPE